MKPGSATYATSADVAGRARDALDRAAGLVGRIDGARRDAVLALVALWPSAAWLAAGCRTPRRWVEVYTSVSYREADRLVQVAALCADHDDLYDALASGVLSMGRAEILAGAVIDDRRRFLTDEVVAALLRSNTKLADDRDFAAVVRHWAELADQEREVTRAPRHRLQLSQSLFGDGQLQAYLSPSAFLNVAAAIDAFCPDPDPADAPYRRGLGERRADAIDDLAHFGLTHGHDLDDDLDDTDDTDDDVGDDHDDEEEQDGFGLPPDGLGMRDDLDELLDQPDSDPDGNADQLDQLDLLRRRLRRQERERRRRLRRRTKARSGVCVNVHLDLHTLAGRRFDQLDDLTLTAQAWTVTERAARRLLCDSALVATLFAGPHRVLDANTANEQFTRSQRRALAARDGGCVFPGCRRPPRWCDAHHLHPRARHGPTVVDNGALLCRFHHRLVHEHGWHLHVDTDTGHWVATDPHGTTWTGRPTDRTRAGPGRPRPPDRPPN